MKDSFDENRESTIGAAFLTQTLQVSDSAIVKFEIWDTAGQERYKSLAPMYYRNANCALVVYDITQPSSLDRAKSWIKELQKQANQDIVIALVGNKLDLEESRQIESETAKEYADEAGLIFSEVSAKNGLNIQDTFRAIAERLPIEEKLSAHRPRGTQRNVDLARPSTNNSQQCAC